MEQWKFKGQDMLNFHAYFDTDFSYNEEFDTSDGTHWKARTEVQNWTPEIIKLAEEAGIIPKEPS